MKKFLPLLLTFCMCFVLAACGNSENIETAGTTGQSFPEEESTVATEDIDTADRKILVAYFSRTGEIYSVKKKKKGNTHIIADMIAEQVGAEIFEISTVVPYPDDYDECTEVAKKEQEKNARPELAASVENIEDYDIIFLGYPIWWNDMPMAIYTFLENYDFSKKTIIPFCTHEGSGISSTESSIAEVCPDAEILEGLEIRGSITQNSQDEAKETVAGWLEKIELIGQE